MMFNFIFSSGDNHSKISKLHKEATALSDSDINKAIDKLKEANRIYKKIGEIQLIGSSLRLPLFLQKAGRFEESVIEFEKLIDSAAKDAELEIPENNRTETSVRRSIHFRLWAIYDKMRVAFKRQKLIDKSIEYGELAARCREKGELYMKLEDEELAEKIEKRKTNRRIR